LAKLGISQSDKNYKAEVAKYLPSSLYNDLIKYPSGNKDNDKWWNSRVLTNDEKSKLEALLSTPEGKKAQDEQSRADVKSYIEVGRGLGVIDEKALIYFADLYNQRPASALDIVTAVKKAGKALTLENIHKAALANSIMGDYSSRRNVTYKKCSFIIQHFL
jgi:hypothetical protein